LIKKIFNYFYNFSAVIFFQFLVIKTKTLDPDRYSAYNAGSGSRSNEYGLSKSYSGSDEANKFWIRVSKKELSIPCLKGEQDGAAVLGISLQVHQQLVDHGSQPVLRAGWPLDIGKLYYTGRIY
jgi:hypothetical protein